MFGFLRKTEKRLIIPSLLILLLFALLNLGNSFPKIRDFLFTPQFNFPNSPSFNSLDLNERTNLLLFNLDDQGLVSRLVITSFNPEDKEIIFVSLNPETFVDLSFGQSRGKFSEVFLRGGSSFPSGIEILMTSVSDNLALALDGYIYLKTFSLEKEELLDIKKEVGGLFNLWKVVKLQKLLTHELRTTLSLADLSSVYQKISSVRGDKITYRELGEVMYEEVEDKGIKYRLLKKEALDNFVQRRFKNQGVEKEAAKVEVKNGTGRPGLASRASRIVGNLGVEVVAIDNAELENIKKTLVIDYAHKPKTTRRLASIFEGEVIERPPEEGKRGDIVVVVGFNYYEKLFGKQ